MGGISFGWLGVWVPDRDWLCRKLELCDFVRCLCETLVMVVHAVPRLCIEYPCIYLTTEEIPKKNFIHGNRMAFGCSVLNAIHLFDLVIAGDGFDVHYFPLGKGLVFAPGDEINPRSV